MKKPSQSAINLVLAAAMLVLLAMAALPILDIKFDPWQFYIYGAAAVAIMVCRLFERPAGDTVILQRLDRLTKVSAFCYLLSAGFMIYYRFFGMVAGGNRNWIALLMAGALIQLYASFRTDHELRKVDKERKK